MGTFTCWIESILFKIKGKSHKCGSKYPLYTEDSSGWLLILVSREQKNASLAASGCCRKRGTCLSIWLQLQSSHNMMQIHTGGERGRHSHCTQPVWAGSRTVYTHSEDFNLKSIPRVYCKVDKIPVFATPPILEFSHLQRMERSVIFIVGIVETKYNPENHIVWFWNNWIAFELHGIGMAASSRATP